MHAYYNAATHSVLIDAGSQITTIKMPDDVPATEIIRMITSAAFIPVIENIRKD